MSSPPPLPFVLDCSPPYLVASFPEPHRVLSWAITKPGLVTAQKVAWLEVRNKDLPAGADPLAVLHGKIATAGLSDVPVLVTSRDIRRHHVAQARVEDAVATCVVTAGLSNGERVGERSSAPVPMPGTINILVHVAQPLSEAAFLETICVVVQARTVAVLEARVSRGGVLVTGTGTDCIAIAAPARQGPEADYAGMHTAIGEAVGRCTLDAMNEAIATWKLDFQRIAPDHRF